MKKRSKYRPRQIRNALQLAVGRYKPISKKQIEDIELFLHGHFRLLGAGKGLESSLWFISAQIEVAQLCVHKDKCVDNKDEFLQACKAAMSGIKRAVARYEEKGVIGLDGDTYTLCRDILNEHMAHMGTIGAGIVEDAIAEVRSRIGRGYLEIAN